MGVTVPVGFILLLVGTVLGLLCGMSGITIVKDIRRRLTRLREKETAEKHVEQKILDKAIVFNINGDVDQRKPLLEKNVGDFESSFIIPIKDVDLVKKIAEGGNGVVYLGRWKGINVAIKAIKTLENESGDEEFEKEVSLLASLHHPYILNFYGVCLTKSDKCMITQYLENGSLDRVLYQCRTGQLKLTLLQKLNMLYEVAAGIDYLHSLDPVIVHRDLVSLLFEFANIR